MTEEVLNEILVADSMYTSSADGSFDGVSTPPSGHTFFHEDFRKRSTGSATMLKEKATSLVIRKYIQS